MMTMVRILWTPRVFLSKRKCLSIIMVDVLYFVYILYIILYIQPSFTYIILIYVQHMSIRFIPINLYRLCIFFAKHIFLQCTNSSFGKMYHFSEGINRIVQYIQKSAIPTKSSPLLNCYTRIGFVLYFLFLPFEGTSKFDGFYWFFYVGYI